MSTVNKPYFRDEEDMDIVLDAIKQAWREHPYLRFGQLLINTASDDAFWVEDDALIRRLKRWSQNP